MRCSPALVALVALVALASAGCTRSLPVDRSVAPAAPSGSRVIVISIDGLMPASYTDPDRLGLAVPTLRRMVASGASARAVEPVFPTVTYPAHTTMVTGVPPAIHGITTNRPPDPLDKNQGGWRWYAEDIAVPTLWQAVETTGRAAALVTWPVTVGAAVTFRVPEYWRAGTSDDQKLTRSLSTPGLLDAVERTYPALWTSLAPPDIRDDAQFAIARYLVTREHPELVLVHAWMLDDAQHAHGPGSAEARAAIENADHLLGELIAELERTSDWTRTIVVVVSDHGFAPVTRQIRLNPLFTDRGLIELGADGKPTASKLTLIASGGTAFVYVTDPTALPAVDAALASVPQIARIYTHDEVVALGGDPAVTYVLAAAPGHQFSDNRAGPVVVDATTRGDHGFPSTDPAMAASFIAFGPAVPHADLGTIRMVDIAPTLARWLDVPLPTATGTPIDLELAR